MMSLVSIAAHEVNCQNEQKLGHKKLTQNMDCMRNIRPGDSEINKTTLSISRGILKRYPIDGTKLQVKIHRCGSYLIISNTRTSNEVLYVLGLGEIKVLCGMKNLNP
jgi:hypothetical protein